MSSGDRLVTLPEISARTGRSIAVLELWARQGRIPAVKYGREWLVNESDIEVIEAMPRRRREAK